MIIGITGAAGSGKDAAAGILKGLLGYDIHAFAEPLHEAVTHIWGKNALLRENKERPQIFGDQTFEWFYSYHRRLLSLFGNLTGLNTQENIVKAAKVRDVFIDRKTGHVMSTITPRRFMQIYGTEYFRSINENFWVEVVKEKIGEGGAILSDVRFENEAYLCDVLLCIKRNVDDIEQHASEQFSKEIASFDGVKVITIDNNGTLEELRDKLISFVNQHLDK